MFCSTNSGKFLIIPEHTGRFLLAAAEHWLLCWSQGSCIVLNVFYILDHLWFKTEKNTTSTWWHTSANISKTFPIFFVLCLDVTSTSSLILFWWLSANLFQVAHFQVCFHRMILSIVKSSSDFKGNPRYSHDLQIILATTESGEVLWCLNLIRIISAPEMISDECVK